MKRYTSRFLKSLALGYMGFPIVYLLLIALLFDVPAGKCLKILLSPSFMLLSVSVMISGYALWEVKRWSWHVITISTIMIAVANTVIAIHFSESHHSVLAYIISIAIVLGLFLRIGRELRVPYFYPRIRWWESNPRYKLSCPAELIFSQRPTIYGEILDVSMGGCFIKLRQDIALHELITIKFMIFGLEIICPGNVVWCTQSAVTHPKGIGVKFAPLPRQARKALHAVTGRLKEITSLYRSSRFLLPQEEFLRRLDALQTKKLSLATASPLLKTSKRPFRRLFSLYHKQ